MTDKLWTFLFGEASLLRQAYAWFVISLALIPVFFIVGLSTAVALIGVLSCLALTISAQAFIAAAKANKRLAEMEQQEIDSESKATSD